MIPAPSPVRSADLFVETPSPTNDDRIEFACRLVEAKSTRRLWFRFPRANASMLSTRADPFVLATLVYAMGRLDRLHVHGTVSDGLFANLADFQDAFASFQRQSPAPIEFSADEIAPAPRRGSDAGGITAFSGGVDSCFSAFRHTSLSPLAPKRPLRAALMMHGFDIPLARQAVFERAAERSRRMIDDAGLTFFAGSTNLRELPVPWEKTFATAVAASLSFFHPAFSFGLVPSCHDWSHAHFDNGSNPVTDPLLSSFSYQIIHDGTRYGRIEKLRHLGRWPAALRDVRVCWQGQELDRNCCRCEKCLRTMLMLRVAGVPDAPAFPEPIDLGAVERVSIRSKGGLDEFDYLLSEARRLDLREPWIAPAERALSRNRRARAFREAARSVAHALPPSLRDLAARPGRRLFGQPSPPSPLASTVSSPSP
jgi:hypothetical protein